MKILHIGKYFPPYKGGMESFLEDLARTQVAGGHEVVILCHQHQKSRPTETSEVLSGLKVIRERITGVVVYSPVAPVFYKTLARLLTTFQPDVIHTHLPNLSAFWLLLFKSLPRMVIHWHSDVVASEIDWKLSAFYPGYRILEKKILARADRIIATSKSYLTSSVPLRPFRSKCIVIPLGMSFEKMNNINQMTNECFDSGQLDERQVPEGDFVLSVGRFTYYKGYEYIIRACCHGFQRRLVLVGDGPLRQGLVDLAYSLNVQERILMPGKINDEYLHCLLRKCCAFCLPSIERTEAFGVVLLEAMFYGKPLITTRVKGSGMNEVNIHGETGLVVSPEDSSQLALAMNFLLDQKNEAAKMGQRARQRLEERYEISRVVREIDKVYE